MAIIAWVLMAFRDAVGLRSSFLFFPTVSAGSPLHPHLKEHAPVYLTYGILSPICTVTLFCGKLSAILHVISASVCF